MQAISAELTASLAKKNPVYKKTVEIERRLWSAGAFIYDTALDITDQVKKYSPISWKFDSEAFNSWTLDNTSLVFRNDRNQWKQGNAKGYFSGLYQIAESKITIKFGAQLADGTFEVLKSFTGYIANDPIVDPFRKQITVTIQGGMSKFGKESAEAISNPITDEAHAYTAPDIVDYNTVNLGVAASGLVVKRGTTAGGAAAATEIKPTTGYTIAGQNSKVLPLTVTLVSALTATESIWITYKYWYQDKTLEWLVKEVLTLNGITDHSGVEAAKFSSSIENAWDFNSQADWETCGLTNIGTKAFPGSFQRKWFLIDDFTDGDKTSNPVWTVIAGLWSVSGGKLNGGGVTGNSTIKTACSKTVGTWEARIAKSASTNSDSMYFNFMATGSTQYGGNGYAVYFSSFGGPPPTTLQVRLIRLNSGGSITSLGLINTTVAEHLVRVTRDALGNMSLYIDGVFAFSANDTTYLSSTEMTLRVYNSTNPYGVCTFDDIRFSDDINIDAYESDNPAILASPEYGVITGLTSWGKVAVTATDIIPLGILIETSVWNGASWDAWVAIDGTGNIKSLPYATTNIKFRASLTTPAGNAVFDTPIVDQILVTHYTSTTLIDLVDLTGMTCKQVLDRITEMPAYEQGFKADETFVYRPRVTSVAPVIDFRSDTNIREVRNVNYGADRVYNSVTAEFGIYKVVADASADAHPNSMDIFKTRDYPVSSSSLLPAANVNIAYAIAPTILAYTKTPRRRCVVESMFLPQLELGDKGTLYFNEPMALRRWLWGDTDVAWGQADIEYYNETIIANRYNFWGVVVRIEGVELDPDTFMTTFNLTEVLI